MRTANIVIVLLIGIGLVGLGVVEGYIKPELRRQEQQYALEQEDPLTHDFSRALKFRSKYTGDISNLANLNSALPLSDIERTFSLKPDKFAATINFQEATDNIDPRLFRHSLVYNTTANFVLIDNLETIIINFEDLSFTASRDGVESWYGTPLGTLQEEDKWRQKVQNKLKEKDFADSFINTIFQ